MGATPYRHEINGKAAEVDALASLATFNFGHFTSMQVRGRAARGLDLHLGRLVGATRELFAIELDAARVRRWLLHALAHIQDASVRISIFPAKGSSGDAVDDVDVLISVSPARDDGNEPLRVRSVVHERYLPHLKHVATLPLIHHGQRARAVGFDDALFVNASGHVSEGTIWNIALFDGSQIVWPAAPKLVGITMQLIITGLETLGIQHLARSVSLAELPEYTAAAICYSVGAGRPIRSVDNHIFSAGEDFSRIIRQAYESSPFQPV